MKKIRKSRLVGINGSKIMVLEKQGRPLRYTLPGGIKKRRESIRQALVRETAEEIELELKEEQIQFFLSRIKRTEVEKVTKNYYYAFLKQTNFKVLEMDKFKNVVWIKWKKATRHMDKSDRIAVKVYFKNIGRKEKNKKKYGSQISPRIAM